METTSIARWGDAGSRPPALVRTINWLARPLASLIELDEAALVEWALREHADFSPDRLKFRDGLRAFTQALNREARLNFVGRLVSRLDLIRLIRTQVRVQEALERWPKVAQEEIRRPVFIVGLPRTGTTILLNLLAQDPVHRPLRLWEGMDPVPAERGPDRRVQRARSATSALDYLGSNLQSIHPMGADRPEECVLLFMPFFATPQFEYFYHVPGYIEWLEARGMEDAYRRYRDELQLIQYAGRSQTPTTSDRGTLVNANERWLLKDPAHLLGLDHILELLPDASVTHERALAFTDIRLSNSDWIATCYAAATRTTTTASRSRTKIESREPVWSGLLDIVSLARTFGRDTGKTASIRATFALRALGDGQADVLQ